MKERPGFMLYFEVLPALDIMDDEAVGRLFRALVAYGQYGEVRDITGQEAIAFRMMRGRMDRDAAAYRERCRKNMYNAYLRLSKHRGEVPLGYEDWEATIVDDRQPTTTTNTNPTTNPNANPNTNPNTNPNVISNTKSTPSGGDFSTGFSTEFSTNDSGGKADDAAWVLDYLAERNQNRQGGAACRKKTGS